MGFKPHMVSLRSETTKTLKEAMSLKSFSFLFFFFFGELFKLDTLIFELILLLGERRNHSDFLMVQF